MEIVKDPSGSFFYRPLKAEVYVPHRYDQVLDVAKHGDMASEKDLSTPDYNPIPALIVDRLERVLIGRGCIEERVKALAKEISNDYKKEGVDRIVVAYVLRGAVYFFKDLTWEMDPNIIQVADSMVVSSYDGKESEGVVRIVKDLAEKVQGQHLLIVEDIVDTGLTYSVLEPLVKLSKKPKSIKLVALCDKPTRREKDLGHVSAHYMGFVVPNVFIVGYGLDYDNAYRNLKCIVSFKPTPEELAREANIERILDFEFEKGLIILEDRNIRKQELLLRPELVGELLRYVDTFSK